MTDYYYYSGRHGKLQRVSETERRKLIREAEDNGWTLVHKPMTWEHGRLQHEDGTFLHPHNDDRGYVTGSTMHRPDKGRGFSLSRAETYAAIRDGARCKCHEVITIFEVEETFKPEDDCPFRHEVIRKDIEVSERARKAWAAAEAGAA